MKRKNRHPQFYVIVSKKGQLYSTWAMSKKDAKEDSIHLYGFNPWKIWATGVIAEWTLGQDQKRKSTGRGNSRPTRES